MAISDRIVEAVNKLSARDPISALIQLMIAVDATAQKEYPDRGVGDRFRGFFRDHQAFITRVAFGILEIQGDVVFQFPDRVETLEQVLYRLVRCALLHEGSLSDEVTVSFENKIGMERGRKVILPVSLVWALILAVIGLKVNAQEALPDGYVASIGVTSIPLNRFWGKKDEIYQLVCQHNP